MTCIVSIASRHTSVSMRGWKMVRTGVPSLQRQCCRQICRCGIAAAEYAVQQLPVFMAPALLAAATRSQLHDVASCIISNWPLPVLRYVELDSYRCTFCYQFHNVHCVPKKFTHVACYIFYIHEPIWIIYGSPEKVNNRKLHYFPTSPNYCFCTTW